MSAPLVHVLVINWNGREHLEECFETLLKSDYERAEFVLVDNASSDDSVAFVRERFGADPRVAILECEDNLGWSGGNNRGMERALESGAEYVLLLNNDTTTEPDAISKLVERAEIDLEIGALAPKLLLYDTPELINSVGLEASIVGAAWDKGIGERDDPQFDVAEDIIGVCGAGFFIRSEALRKTGLLPTDFEIYLDDLDLSLRIWNAGYRIESCPAARIHHKFSSTMGTGKRARRKYYLNTRNRLRLILRNYPARAMPMVLFRYDLSEWRAVGRAALEGRFWAVAAHLRSWVDGVLYLPAALRERGRRKRMGLSACRFWNLVRKDMTFFPGFEISKDL